jgi:hypothetical protein
MTPRFISNTETAMSEPRKRCNSLACDLCVGHDTGECAPLPAKRQLLNSKQSEADARRLAIIEAQERLALGI